MKNTENKPEKIFIGVSWPYANGEIHLGHLAGQYVVCDIFARYHRLKGNKVLMVSGSDSHGAPVIFKAEEEGVTPEKYAEESHKKIVDTYKKLGFLYENYTKTTTENHKKVVQNIFLVLKDLGYLEIKESQQYYDPKVKRFLPDRYVRGTCPECSADNARGDECPECGAYLDPEDLIKPYSTLSDATPVLKKTEHFYLNLDRVEKEISKWIKANDSRWRKWVREFTKGWIKQGLEQRCVTRDLSFGVKVPIDGWDEKVIYVWIEAVVGYLSAAIEWAEKSGKAEAWEDFWKDPECKHYYFIAGGNVPFHTIIWPAEIIAYNQKYKDEKLKSEYKLPGETSDKPLNLPYDVPANKMLFFKGRKMSKGDTTGITADDLLKVYSPDVIRYFFCRYAPENHDREYTWKDFIDANNNELVANIGNFINRVLTFTQSKFQGIVPEGELSEEVSDAIDKAFKDTGRGIEKTNFVKAIESVLELGKFANKYFNDNQPWETVKSDFEEAGNTIYNTIQLVNAFRVLLKPFTPFASEELRGYLNIAKEYDANIELEKSNKVTNYVDTWAFDKIESGTRLSKPEILFEKLEYTQDLQDLDAMDPDQQVEVEIEFVQDKSTRVLPVITEVVKGLKIQKKQKAVSDWIKRVESKVIERYQGDKKWRERPEFQGFRDLHKKYSGESFQPSTEKLVEFILEKGKLPNINTFVDIYNAISALTGVSIGAHDTSKIIGQPKLTILENDTQFQGISDKKKNTAKKGEYAYVDGGGILCRLDIKQSVRTRVSEKTSDVLLILQGHRNIDKKELDAALVLLHDGLKLIRK